MRCAVDDVLGVAFDEFGVQRISLLRCVPRNAPANEFFRRTAVESTPCLAGLGG
jgi:hypothetical protein